MLCVLWAFPLLGKCFIFSVREGAFASHIELEVFLFFFFFPHVVHVGGLGRHGAQVGTLFYVGFSIILSNTHKIHFAVFVF